MKNLIYILSLSHLTISSFSQTWQWGKRGGSNDQLDENSGHRREEVYSIATDSQKNIYILSSVGQINLNIDGNPKTNYADSTTITDIALASFACDGSYRWSKVIGGQGIEEVHSIQIDNNDNIFISGQFRGCGNNSFPPRIENDIIISQNPTDCSTIFIAKFSIDGVMQWFKRPQLAGVSLSVGLGQTASKGMAVDNLGNSFWLILIPPGEYADGAFTNTLQGSNWYVFKYDADGNFISATHLDFEVNESFRTTLQFYRNPNNGQYYLIGTKGSSSGDTATIAGQTVINSLFFASFANNGQFIWKRENTATSPGSIYIYNVVFDNSDNIYLGGRFLGFGMNSFVGFTIPEPIIPSFVMKLTPTADNVIWASYHNKGTLSRGAIALNGNQLGFTSSCFGPDFTWGDQTIFASNSNQGTETLLARFNTESGECIGLTKIDGNTGFDDAGTALAVDASGDYILGGGFGQQLTINGNTLTNAGPQSDFFVAKYATSPCSQMAVNEASLQPKMQVYPNPADSKIEISVSRNMAYKITNLSGQLITAGNLTLQNNSIDVIILPKGFYFLNLFNDDGAIHTVKFLKK